MAYRSAPLHPVLRLIYALLRFTTRVGVTVYYRKRLVLGRENLDFDGPAIIVSNHPSTLLDPLNVGLNIRQEMFFLANYGLFKTPLGNWLFSRLFCIPVKRKEDVPEGAPRDNDAAFEKSYQHLEKNGVLYIAAEGVSWMNRFVRPFKTGTARIAFGAEHRNDWQLELKIVPVGLSYDAPWMFRSRCTVAYGAPIDARQWFSAAQENHEKAVDELTAEIQRRVSALSLDAVDEAGEKFLNQLELLLRNALSKKSQADIHLITKALLDKYRTNPVVVDALDKYVNTLEQAGIEDLALAKRTKPFDLFLLLLLLPFFLLGYAFLFLPCLLPWLLCKRLKLYPGYDGTIKMLAGLITFPLAFWGAWEMVYSGFDRTLWAWLSLPFLVVCAYLTEIFLDLYHFWKVSLEANAFRKKNTPDWQLLNQQRDELLRKLLKDVSSSSGPQQV